MFGIGLASNQAVQEGSVDEKSSSVPFKIAVRLKGIGVIRLVVVDTKCGKVRKQMITKTVGHHLFFVIRFFLSFCKSCHDFPKGKV